MTKPEEKTLIELLRKLQPGFYPLEIFLQLARLVVLPIVEFVPLRLRDDGKVEVLLLTRESDDAIWPNQLHTPGTVIRPTDIDSQMYLPFKRIVEDELNGTEISSPHYVGNLFNKSKRGVEQAQIYWVEATAEPKTGQFYPVDELPPNLVDSQPKFIEQAAQSFLRLKQQNH